MFEAVGNVSLRVKKEGPPFVKDIEALQQMPRPTVSVGGNELVEPLHQKTRALFAEVY